MYELKPEERLAILNVLTKQLLTYASYRESFEQRMAKLQEVKKEIKQLKNWDNVQEKEAKEARLVREYEKEAGEKAEVDEKKSKPGRAVSIIRSYLKAVNDGRRILNFDEAKLVRIHRSSGKCIFRLCWKQFHMVS